MLISRSLWRNKSRHALVIFLRFLRQKKSKVWRLCRIWFEYGLDVSGKGEVLVLVLLETYWEGAVGHRQGWKGNGPWWVDWVYDVRTDTVNILPNPCVRGIPLSSRYQSSPLPIPHGRCGPIVRDGVKERGRDYQQKGNRFSVCPWDHTSCARPVHLSMSVTLTLKWYVN